MSYQHCEEPRNVSASMLHRRATSFHFFAKVKICGRTLILVVEVIEKLVRFLCALMSTYFLNIDLDFVKRPTTMPKNLLKGQYAQEPPVYGIHDILTEIRQKSLTEKVTMFANENTKQSIGNSP